MLRHLVWALLAVGCASSPPPEPRVVERVVYVEAPCKAPVIVERSGHRSEPRLGMPWQSKGKKRGEWAKKHASRCDRKSLPEARERCKKNLARR